MSSSITDILNAIVEFFKPSAPAPTIVNPRLKSSLKDKPILIAKEPKLGIQYKGENQSTSGYAVVKLAQGS
jgi:hypothetical protein